MERTFVSVIMPAFNANKKYIKEAVLSILNQTYADFELIIIDDGSNIPVSELISDINDSRIKIITNEKNMGLPFSLNRGIKVAVGEYVFRMDADDICVNTRLEKQVSFLNSNLDIDIVASYALTFGAIKKRYKSKTLDKEIKAEMFWQNPIVHPTVAFRKSYFEKNKIEYSDEYLAEDYELWSRLAFENHCRFHVIPETLLYYRMHDSQVTSKKREKLLESEEKIFKRNLKLLNINISDSNFEALYKIKSNHSSFVDIVLALNTMRLIRRSIKSELSKSILMMIFLKSAIKNLLKK
ncbi:glycosyltransferase [Candidatus Galacturonibacter soehngenii]|uniref:Glycosyltransferase n=1 Tax=Candidatus Galacturonatibacter soehngenii TaxID=2307010 RepID=A0A7V7UC30_9FIRM|nr:glycosyltransferase [Candidatus Galacturonibacter soehngenii]KAB1438244.1 glycosyltransferase [Candidatus Galacturonibacter soehngenii]